VLEVTIDIEEALVKV